MATFKNSNGTFWGIFKHYVHFLKFPPKNATADFHFYRVKSKKEKFHQIQSRKKIIKIDFLTKIQI